MRRQLEAFRKKFGRDPGPRDPVFFDPDADEPKPTQDIQEDVVQAMNNANLRPEFAYAYRKTGLLGLSADKSFWPPEHIAEWNAAIDEYRAIEDAKRASSPKQKSPAMAESDEDRAKFLGFTPEEFERWQHLERRVSGARADLPGPWAPAGRRTPLNPPAPSWADHQQPSSSDRTRRCLANPRGRNCSQPGNYPIPVLGETPPPCP